MAQASTSRGQHFWTLKHITLLFSNTAMFTILQGVIVYAILYALWKLWRQFLIKLPLDNIPGPPSHSFLFGEIFEPLFFETAISSSIQSPGVFPQLFNINGWEFHKYIEQKCMIIFQSLPTGSWHLVDGSVIKIKAFLGVCAISFL